MSRPQRLLLALLVLLLVGGGVGFGLFGLGNGGDLDIAAPQPRLAPTQDLNDPNATTGGRQDLEDPGRDEQPFREGNVLHPLEVELVQVTKGVFEDSELPPPGSDANARLKGFVRGERGSGIPATVKFVGGPNEGRELRTDSLGHFGSSDLYQGLSLVRVEADTGLVSEREVALRQLSEAELNLDFSRRAAAHVRGMVKDPFGEPIVGAEVHLDGGVAFSDDTGEFAFPRVTPGKVPLTAKKHGYAQSYQVIGVVHGRTIDREKLTVTMHPGIDLEVRLEAAVGSPGPVQVFILPVGGASVSTGLGQRTFPWHAINPVTVYPGGSTLVEGLQPGHVSILAFHPGAVASPPIVNKNLVAGRQNQHLVRLRSAPTAIRGTVTTADGVPARRARVRLEDPTRGFATTKAMQKRNPAFLQGLVAPHLPAAVQETTTDKAGRFVLTAFPEITPKGYYLTVESEDGTAAVSRVVPSETSDLDLILEPVAQTTGALELYMGGRFQGLDIALKINGQPQEVFTLSALDQLVVDSLDPGQWRVDVWWNQSHLVDRRMLAIAPEKKATLPVVLPRGATEGGRPEEEGDTMDSSQVEESGG